MEQTKLVDAFRQMVLVRRFDETALQLRLAGKIVGVVHPYIGEEAVAVGAVATLEARDMIVSHHRGHGHLIARGANVGLMMAELLGRTTGHCHGKGGSMHIADYDAGILGANGIVGAGLPIGAGAALAAQMLETGAVVMVFFGDGATGQGVFHESLNIAALQSLPIVFVCENNQYAAETPVAASLATPDVANFGGSYGVPSAVIDGGDVLAVYDACATAVARARSGNGPTLLECKTHRWGVHSQRGNPVSDKRSQDAMAWARSRDPIAAFRRWLIDTGVATNEELDAVCEEVDTSLSAALAFAEASPIPDPEAAYTDVFASGGVEVRPRWAL